MAAEFEISRNITIGQYIPTGSFIHKLDPRVKVFVFAVIVLAIAFNTSYIGNVIGLIFTMLLFLFARIPIRYGLSGVKPAIPFIIILALMQLLFQGSIFPGGTVYFHYSFILITSESIKIIIVSALRFIEIIFISSVLTLATSTTELTHAIQSLLGPLKKVKFPVHEFSLIITIAIRFVPTFAIEMEKMLKAQASRGVEFGTGAWWHIIRRTKEMFPIIIPLFNIAMSRAEDLILAMESRCYIPGAKRSSYTSYHISGKDILILIVGLLFAVFLFIFPFPV